MARRRYGRRYRRKYLRTQRRIAYKRVPRRKRKSHSYTLLKNIGGAIGYGALREKVSNKLEPILTNKLGNLGGFSDEIVMLGVNYGVGKMLPIARPVTKAGMIIEGARIGEKLIGVNFGSTSSNGSVKVYS